MLYFSVVVSCRIAISIWPFLFTFVQHPQISLDKYPTTPNFFRVYILKFREHSVLFMEKLYVENNNNNLWLFRNSQSWGKTDNEVILIWTNLCFIFYCLKKKDFWTWLSEEVRMKTILFMQIKNIKNQQQYIFC